MSSSAALNSSLDTLSYVDFADHSGVNSTSNSILIRYGLVGDVNGDGSVNLADLLLLTRSFGATNSDSGLGDFNFDGSTSISDFLALVRNFGKTLGTSVTAAKAAAPSTAAARRV